MFTGNQSRNVTEILLGEIIEFTDKGRDTAYCHKFKPIAILLVPGKE
jgi:hypothetical protein